MNPADGMAARIRERRTGNALSQSELAERLNVSQATISLWEQGKGKPNKDQIQKLEQILPDFVADQFRKAERSSN